MIKDTNLKKALASLKDEFATIISSEKLFEMLDRG